MRHEQIPVFDGPASVKPGSKGRMVDLSKWSPETPEFDREVFLEWAPQYRRKYKPMLDPLDHSHVLTDDEIDRLISNIRHGWNARDFVDTTEFVQFLKYREQIYDKEHIYGSYEADVSVVRFFDNKVGTKNENILADIRALNEKEGMGNVKIPNTTIELINFSPCPKCSTIHTFADVFNYYRNPTPDPFYTSREQQYQFDTRVQCKDCKSYFLPALIIVDGTPCNEHQMICRSQTIREVSVFHRKETRQEILWMKKDNFIERSITDAHNKIKKERAWRNDASAKILKKEPGLFSNFLQYQPANEMLDFISGANLEKDSPLYGAWLPHDKLGSFR